MSVFKYTMFFSEGTFGWSESWFFTQATDDIFTARLKVGQIPQARAFCLGETASLVGDRVALVEDVGGNHVTNRADPRDFFFAGTAGKPTVPVRTSLLLRYRTADQVKSKLVYMGGVWREVNPFDDAYLIPNASTFGSVLNNYHTKIFAAGLGWKVQGAKVQRQIEMYSVNAATGIVSFTVAAPGMGFGDLTIPQRVTVAFLGNVTPLDGSYDVFPSLQTAMTSVRPRPAKAGLTGGVMRRFDPAYVYLNTAAGQVLTGTATVERFVGRQRGKGSLVSRGRARAIQRF